MGNIITEDYVSFETAKLLKEKGFNKDVLVTDWWYDAEGKMHKWENYSYSGAPSYDKETCFNCPTLQMAMKWLRKVHKVGVFLTPHVTVNGDDMIHVYDSSILNPTWDEERKAVFIPIVNKYLDAKHSEEEMTWEDAMAYAEKTGTQLPGRYEMYFILAFKDKINAILEEHGGDLLTEWAWTSTEYSANNVWGVNFNNGLVNIGTKYDSSYVRAVTV